MNATDVYWGPASLWWMRPESGLTPPLALWARGTGDLGHLTAAAITITGSRAATAYGEHVAGELAQNLGHHGHTVISAAPTASTPPPTAAPSPQAPPPSPSWPAGSTSATRQATSPCWAASPTAADS